MLRFWGGGVTEDFLKVHLIFIKIIHAPCLRSERNSALPSQVFTSGFLKTALQRPCLLWGVTDQSDFLLQAEGYLLAPRMPLLPPSPPPQPEPSLGHLSHQGCDHSLCRLVFLSRSQYLPSFFVCCVLNSTDVSHTLRELCGDQWAPLPRVPGGLGLGSLPVQAPCTRWALALCLLCPPRLPLGHSLAT